MTVPSGEVDSIWSNPWLVALHVSLTLIVVGVVWALYSPVAGILGGVVFAWIAKKQVDRSEHFRQKYADRRRQRRA